MRNGTSQSYGGFSNSMLCIVENIIRKVPLDHFLRRLRREHSTFTFFPAAGLIFIDLVGAAFKQVGAHSDDDLTVDPIHMSQLLIPPIRVSQVELQSYLLPGSKARDKTCIMHHYAVPPQMHLPLVVYGADSGIPGVRDGCRSFHMSVCP